MALITTVDQLLFTSMPSLPWPSQQTSRTLHAVVLLQDYAYVDSTHNIPLSIRGKIPPALLIHGRLPLFKDEPGFLFSRDPSGRQAMVLIVKGTKHLAVVLPTNILREGKPFLTLADQTSDLFRVATTPSVPLQVQHSDTVFNNFVRTFWSSVANQPAALRQLGLQQPDFDNYFGGHRLRDNVNSILSAVLPQVRQVLQHGTFSLRDLLNLPHASPAMASTGPCVYLRIYDHLEGQPPNDQRDASQDDINHDVGFYVGKSNDVWRRHRDHEVATTQNSDFSRVHYGIARKSSPEHRHTIPLIGFPPATVPEHVINLAEQTMIIALRSYQAWLFKPAQHGAQSMAMHSVMQRRAQFLAPIARHVRPTVGWPCLEPRGCNGGSPLFEFRKQFHIHCIPMAPGDTVYTRTFTTYRLPARITWTAGTSGRASAGVGVHLVDPHTGHREHILLTVAKQIADAQGPKPTDVERGYLIFEIMDDKKPHPRAWVGVPSVGPFQNFDRASSLAVRFEWFDGTIRTWYTISLQRLSLLREPMREIVSQGDLERLLVPWRSAMKLIQALEGIIYTGPLDGFHKELVIGDVNILQTDHLNQRYRWVPRPKKVLPTPARASWEENFNLMHRLFDTPVTHIGPSEPLQSSSDVLNRELGDMQRKPGIRCDTCTYMGASIQCVRDESRTDCWVCKCCSLLGRPCSFTAWGDSKRLWGDTKPLFDQLPFSVYPTGPHRYMAYHYTMNANQLGQVRVVPIPLFEKLGVNEEEGDEDEGEEAEEIGNVEVE